MRKEKIYNWEDITLKQFDKIHKATHSEFNTSDVDNELMVRFLSILYEKNEDFYLSMPFNEFNKESEKVKFLFKDYVTPDIKTAYTVNNKKYKLYLSISKMSTGQYFDFNSALSKYPDNYAKQLSCLLIPLHSKSYGDGYDTIDVSNDLYEHFKYLDAVAIRFFFVNILENLSIATLQFLIKKQTKMIKKTKDQIKIKELTEQLNQLQEHLIIYRSLNR